MNKIICRCFKPASCRLGEKLCYDGFFKTFLNSIGIIEIMIAFVIHPKSKSKSSRLPYRIKYNFSSSLPLHLHLHNGISRQLNAFTAIFSIGM